MLWWVFAVADGGAPLLQVTRKPNSICRRGRPLTKRKEPRDAHWPQLPNVDRLQLAHAPQLSPSFASDTPNSIAHSVESHSLRDWKHQSRSRKYVLQLL